MHWLLNIHALVIYFYCMSIDLINDYKIVCMMVFIRIVIT